MKRTGYSGKHSTFICDHDGETMKRSVYSRVFLMLFAVSVFCFSHFLAKPLKAQPSSSQTNEQKQRTEDVQHLHDLARRMGAH